MAACLIGLGSNLGHRAENISGAVHRLAMHPQIKLLASSEHFETAPVGGPANQGNFLNAAALVETTLSPHELLAELLRLESEMGRVRDVHWGPRTIDLDLLLYGDEVIEAADLKIPHPLLHTRRFVLEPAAEIAPGMVHPVSRRTIAELLSRLNEGAADSVQ